MEETVQPHAQHLCPRRKIFRHSLNGRLCGPPVWVWMFWKGDKFLVPAGIRTLRRPARNLVTITLHFNTGNTIIAGLEFCGRRKVCPVNYDQNSSFIVHSSTVWFPFFYSPSTRSLNTIQIYTMDHRQSVLSANMGLFL